jgi:hypothetical protein
MIKLRKRGTNEKDKRYLRSDMTCNTDLGPLLRLLGPVSPSSDPYRNGPLHVDKIVQTAKFPFKQTEMDLPSTKLFLDSWTDLLHFQISVQRVFHDPYLRTCSTGTHIQILQSKVTVFTIIP